MADNKVKTEEAAPRRRPAGGGGGGHMGRMLTVKPKDFKATFKRLLNFLRPYWIGLAIVMVSTVIMTVLSSFAPRVMGYATNEIARGSMAFLSGGNGIDFTVIGNILFWLTCIYVVTSVLRYGLNYVMAEISQRSMFDLREAVNSKLQKLPLEYYDSHSYGEILSRVTNDVDTVSDSLQNSITEMFQAALSIVVTLAMMLWISPTLTLIGIISVPLSLGFSMIIIKKSQKFFRGQQKAVGQLNGYIEEMYSGHSVIKAYGCEEQTVNDFMEINEELRTYAGKAQFISSIMMPVTNFFSNLGYVLVTVVGAGFILNGKLLIGDIQAFVRYLKQLGGPINQTASIMNVLQSTIAAAERIFEVLDATEETPDVEEHMAEDERKGKVVIDHVKFSYDPQTPLIRDLNVTVEPGQRVAIVGPTGAGKTTIVNLLMRFYDVNGGRILIDGVDIREMPRHHLREKFGMVLQDTWLFKGTIMENIRYGKLDADDEEVITAAKLAYAHHFITQLPGGYGFVLGEDAVNISQGQRQLITIARAILSDPIILILDEATSSVDTRTEVLIQKAMKYLMEGRTSFVIAHRLSTIRDSNEILVINDGNVVEQGSHSQLLEADGVYAALYNSQFEFSNKE